MATMPWVVDEANRRAFEQQVAADERRERQAQQVHDEAHGACPTCGSLSPWRCGCPADEAGQ